MHLPATKFCCIRTQPNIKWRNCFTSISQIIIFGFRINNMIDYGRSYIRKKKLYTLLDVVQQFHELNLQQLPFAGAPGFTFSPPSSSPNNL